MNSRGNISKGVLTLFLLTLVVGSALAIYLNMGGSGSEMVEILIPRGSSAGSVATLLKKDSVIKNPLIFKLLVRFTGGSHKIRAGEFRFKRSMSYWSALRVLYNDEPVVHQVTIPEGWNIHQIADILASRKLVDAKKFKAIAFHPTSPTRYQFSAPSLEGYLYPDTYAFSRIDGEEKIIDRMVNQFNAKFDATLRTKARELGWTLEKVVTLASIIEKETSNHDERAVIASVFLNRLKKKMRLQSDPTTIYGIQQFIGNLTKLNLQTYTPYNTYKISGLPPGAIASPGVESLKAVLFPATTDYLFFVANKQGRHVFSKTYAEHCGHVNFYQLGKRAPNRENASKKKKGK
jgi:UPF0755 protein